MKRTILLAILSASLLVPSFTYANGVLVANASTGSCVTLVSSEVLVVVEGQVATTTTTQVFRNTSGIDQTVKYAFPMPEGASATRLRWLWGDVWHTAKFSATAQDTALPGGTMAPSLQSYLGPLPLFFGFDGRMRADSVMTVELTYVQLLPYKFGVVSYSYPNDYHLIQSATLEHQGFAFSLSSQRTITSIDVVSPSGATATNLGSTASAFWSDAGVAASENFVIRYGLNTSQLGLFSYSTRIPDSLGYFLFVAEPDPSSTAIIRKDFSIIVDRSGSMYGTKMTQAISAAQYIVNNLNEGDRFNVIDFDDIITSFRNSLVPYTFAARDSALQYITALYARGNTDIAAAFSRAIPQFQGVPDTVASLIIFLTDGQATAGQTNTDSILAITHRLATVTGANVSIFTFGIGGDVNTQLLTLLATQNNGLAEFLGTDEITARITDFYNSVRNPLLINPTLSFASDSVYDTYPLKLPNLYKGHQLFVSGLYRPTTPFQVTFSGTSFGKPVSYQYMLTLSDTLVPTNEFLPKVWAKMKIEQLLMMYYAAVAGSGVAKELKEEIIALSLAYGVVSPFTSLTTGGGAAGIDESGPGQGHQRPGTFELLGNYPNPFNPGTTIAVRNAGLRSEVVVIRIYTILGQLVRTLLVTAQGGSEGMVYWDGKDERGLAVPSGMYVYTAECGATLLGGRMLLLR
jgi:Ca-activated chloride channel family protein